jgi:periplasmic protein TonB
MAKLFRALEMVHADAASINAHGVKVQDGDALTLSRRPERRWIWKISSGVVVAGMVAFVWAHWPTLTGLAPQQSAFASIDDTKFLLRLSGSNATGPVVVPELVTAWLVSCGASEIQETQNAGPDGNQIPEWLISGRLNGKLLVVEVKAKGSATAFRGMTEGDADIGMTSREMGSDRLAAFMNEFVQFALSAEGQKIITKTRFAPLGEDPEFSNSPPNIALQQDSLKPAITEKNAGGDLPLAPSPPRMAIVAPKAESEPTTTPPMLAAAPVASELIQPSPQVDSVVAEVGSKALSPVAAVVPEAATDRTKAPPTTIVASLSPPPPPPAPTASPQVVNQTPAPQLHIPPLAITNHSVTITDYPLLSIRLQEQGTVLIKYLVKEDGSVGDCTVTTTSGKSLLDDAACAMVKGRWKFKPATKDGKPVSQFLTAEVAFALK